MKHRLFIIEGLPCSGKCTTSAYAAEGFDGYIRCLEERELRILSRLPLNSHVLDNPQRNWPSARETIRSYIEEMHHAETTAL